MSPWEYAVGDLPFKVTAYERLTREGTVYLRWRVTTNKGPNWKRKSLGFGVRDDRGRLLPEAVARAQSAAERQHTRLLAGSTDTERRAAAPLSLVQGLALYCDPVRGAFPVETPYLKEVRRSLDFAMGVLGGDLPWLALKAGDFREVWRRRIQELRADGAAGYRGAEVVIARLLAVAQWLRDEELIPLTAAVAPRRWRDRLKEDWRSLSGSPMDYSPARPRHTIAEMNAILAAAPRIDPRGALLFVLGIDLRHGQVARARRRFYNRDLGELEIHGRGNKRGVVLVLTPGQQRALESALTSGYLRDLEAAGGDFPLFPAGQLRGGRKGNPVADERHRTAKPVNRRTVEEWFKELEALAEVEHQPGRGGRGIRRAMVDGAEGLDREALQELGGWSDSQTPDRIYRDRVRKEARARAARARALIRGEGVTEDVPTSERLVTRSDGSAGGTDV